MCHNAKWQHVAFAELAIEYIQCLIKRSVQYVVGVTCESNFKSLSSLLSMLMLVEFAVLLMM